MAPPSKTRLGRKLLLASIGVAALRLGSAGLAACGNLVAPPPEDTGLQKDGGRDASSAPEDAGALDAGGGGQG